MQPLSRDFGYAMRHDLQAGKKYSVVLLGNGDVPLDKVAFFTTGLTTSIELLEWGRTFSGF